MDAQVSRFHCEGRPVAGDERRVDAAGPHARDCRGWSLGQSKQRADSVGRVVHGRQALPVPGPSAHLLLVGATQELQPTESSRSKKVLHEEELARVHDRLHHHVVLPGGLDGGDDGLTLVKRSRHGHGARDVLARVQRSDRLASVVGDRRVQMYRVHIRILEQRVERGVPLLDAERVTDSVQLLAVAAADGRESGTRMTLIGGNELRAEAETPIATRTGTDPYASCSSKLGISTTTPPLIADSCAARPAAVH